MATSGDMQLQLILALTDKISSGLDRPIAKLRALDTKVAESYKVISNLQRLMGQPVNTGGIDNYLTKVKQLDKVSGASRRIDNFNKKLNAIGDVKASPGLDNLLNKVDRLGGARGGYGDNYRGRHSERHSTLARLERGRDMLNAPREIGDVWRRQADGLREYADATLDLARAQAKFQAINLSPQDNAKAFAVVNETVKNVRGVTLTGATKLITDLHTATGSLEHAVESLPIASKYQFAYESLYGDKFSSDQIENQIQNAFKYLEMTGKVAQGREAMERSFNVMAQMGAATGGRVNAEEMLLMARRGGASVRGLSDVGLRNTSALIQEFGGAGAGQSMMSVYQALVGGHMQQPAMAEFQRLGFLDKKRVEFNKSGIIKRVLPGGNALGEMFMEDPLKAADALMDAMHRKGITRATDIRNELAVLFSNRNANKFVDTLITQRPQIVKESNLAAGAKDIEGLNKQALDSPLGKIKQFEAELTDFKAKVGLPIIEVATKVGTALMPIGEFFSQHEGIARFTGEMFIAQKGLSGILGTATTLNQSGLLGFFSNTGRGASAAAAEIEAAATKTAGLKGKLGSLAASSPLKLSVQFLVAGAAIDQIMQWKREYDDRQKDMESKSALTSKAYDDYIFSGHGFVGGKKGQEYGVERDSLAQKSLDTFKGGRTLEVSLEPERRGVFENFWTAQRMYSPRWLGMGASKGTDFDPARAAAVWRSSEAMRPLGDPTVLAKLLMKIDQGAGMNLSPSGKDAFKQGLSMTVDKDTYSMAVKLAAEETTELGKTTQGTSKALGDLLQAANPLPASLLNFNSALNSASAEASGFHIEMPNMTSVFGNMQQKVEPSTARPQFNLGQPSAKPRSSLDTFFHKTSALDADAVRRPAYIRAAAIDVNSTRPSFAATQARVATRQGKQIGDVHIHIDGNAPAAKDPQLLAASIREELSKLSQQVGNVTAEMRDDRVLERRITWLVQRGRERA
jgi:hypothetical protein